MREDAFRAYLAPRLGGPAVVASYLSNARLVEKRLHVDLDGLELTVDAIGTLRSRLTGCGVGKEKASDCGAALRRYAMMLGHLEDGGAVRRRSRQAATAVAPTVPPPKPGRSSLVTGAGVPALMRLYGDILAELRDRGIARTANGPVGDYAEHLFASAFGWTLAANAETGFDATGADGVRYQIKGRRLDTPRAARQLSAIRRLPERSFDMLALVLFDRGMAVLRAALVPHAVVAERARFIAHTNSWRLMVPDLLWRVEGVVDVTDVLRAAT